MKNINEMTLKEKLGQLIMVGFDGYEYNEHIRTLVEDYKVSNVILFNRNVSNIKQLVKLNKKIYSEILKHTNTIPLISIDQEGGIVTRIMNGATFCPGNMTISSTTNVNNAYEIGKIMGEELLKLGINFNLAPSLDVNNNPMNPVIGVRSYGDNPKVVSDFGNAYIKGLQEYGIIATAKHFPGHGDTNVDSHLGLPTVLHDLDRLNEVEFVPFRSAIEKGVRGIMSAHIIFKAIDDVPGTLSEKVLTNLLREKFGFKGLIVSDCMQMKAIDDLYTTSKGVVMGIKAGLNVACVSHSLEKQLDSLKALEEAVNNKEISMDIIDERVSRVLRIKEEISKNFIDNFYNASDEEIIDFFNSRSVCQEFAQDVCDKSLTLLRGKNINLKGKSLVIATMPYATTIAEDKLNSRSVIDMVKAFVKDVDTITIDMKPENVQEIVDRCKEYDSIVMVTYNANSNKEQAVLANSIARLNKNYYVIASRNPYDLLQLDECDNVLCLYEYTPLAVNTIVKCLRGEIEAYGKLPVEVVRRLPIGASIYLGLDDYSIEDNLKYLDLLKKKNISYVFISSHMPEADERFENELKLVLDYCKDNGMKIILDVNKNRLLDLESKGLIEGIDTIRLDYGFSKEEILSYQNRSFNVQLNASTVKSDLIEYLRANNANLDKYSLSHNFFPKPYTGLSYEEVKKRNEYYHSMGFKVMTYMPSFVNRRMPLYKGLVSIEEQRNSNVIANVSELILLGSDMACFGDAFVTEDELNDALDNRMDIIRIPVKLKEGLSDNIISVVKRKHINRLDKSEYMIRSSIRCQGIEENYNNIDINKKDITIDNVLYKRYQGELGIALKEMEKNEAVNVIGHCLCSEWLLESIDGGCKFKLIIK